MRLAQYLAASAARTRIPPRPDWNSALYRRTDTEAITQLIEHGIPGITFECDECLKAIDEAEHAEHGGLCWHCHLKGSEF